MEHQISDTVRIMEQTKALMAEEDIIRRKVRYLGWAFPLLIILIFIIYFSMFYSTIKNIDKEKFFARFEQQAAHILPEIGRELERIGNALLPYYTAEVEKAISGDVPGLEEKLTSEIEKFRKTFDENISNNFTEALGSLKESQKAILVREFPELEGDPEKTTQIQLALQNSMMDWIKGLLVTTLEEHALVFMDLKKVLDSSFKLDEKTKANINAESLASIWLEILNSTLHGEETILEPEKKKK
jgi:hypothetical protein